MQIVTEDWIQLRTFVTPEWLAEGQAQGTGLKVKPSHLNMAMELLHDVLVDVFQCPSVNKLCEHAPSVAFFTQLCQSLHKVVHKQRTWRRTTCQKIVSTIRLVLERITRVGPGVLKAFRLLPLEKAWDPGLGKQYGQLAPENPVRKRLESWIETLRRTTNNRSAPAIRNILSFLVCQALPPLGLDLEHWPENAREITDQALKAETGTGTGSNNLVLLKRICGKGSHMQRKARWLQLFVTRILASEYRLPLEFLDHCRMAKDEAVEECSDSGHDYHRIVKADLEKIHAVAVKSVEDEMFFLTLLTTGMRCGAYAKMQCANVADVVQGKWVARSEGVTLEKGRKRFTFKIHDRVQELIGMWLNKKRGFDSSVYMFPGRTGGYVSTFTLRRRFTNLCKRAECKGKEFHPHALRHSYCHILLEVGNTADVVSKLINHANVSTTQKFYLRESAAEAGERANIPWMRQDHKRPNPVPDFLRAPPTHKNTKTLTHTQTSHSSATELLQKLKNQREKNERNEINEKNEKNEKSEKSEVTTDPESWVF